jgi:hypothetical protein
MRGTYDFDKTGSFADKTGSGGEEKIFWVGVQMSKNMLLSVKQTFTE